MAETVAPSTDSVSGLLLFAVVAFTAVFLQIAILVQLYRRRGFLALWIAAGVGISFPAAAAWSAIGVPALALQVYLGLVLLGLLLAIGLWGYVGDTVRRRLKAIAEA